MDKLYLIDGSSMLYRAFFAIRDLKTKTGIPTNALYGFLRMFFKIKKEYDMKYVAVAFDRKEKTIRAESYDAYKANREKAPDELNIQFGLIRDILNDMGIKFFDMIGYEADDIIGSISKKFSDKGHEVIIFTGDKDYLQLVDENITVMYNKRGISELEEYDLKKIRENYDLNPKDLIELKGLMGDKSDNIPGVYGIGEKTGIKLVKEFGKIENIYDNLDNISSKSTKNKLEGNLKTALMSRELGRIIINLDYSDNLEDYKISKIDKEEIIKDFENLEFNTFLEELDLTNPEENNGSDRKLDFEKIDNLEDFEKFLNQLKMDLELLWIFYLKMRYIQGLNPLR